MAQMLANAAARLFALPEQFRRPVEVAGTIGIEERVEPRSLLREVHHSQAIARGPDVDLADPLLDDRLAQGLAQPHRPQPDDRMRSATRRAAGEVGAGRLPFPQQARDEIAG